VVCSLVRDGSYKVDVAYDGFGNVLDSWNMSTYTNFTWGGGHGYRQTGLAYSSVYVRARHYSNMDAGWTSRDPLWPQEMPYGYVNGRVPSGVDYWGMQSVQNDGKFQAPIPKEGCSEKNEGARKISNSKPRFTGVPQGIGIGPSVGVSVGAGVSVSISFQVQRVCQEAIINQQEFECKCSYLTIKCMDETCRWVPVGTAERCKGTYCEWSADAFLGDKVVIRERFKPYSNSPGCSSFDKVNARAAVLLCQGVQPILKKECEKLARGLIK
jgi:hypothetical protein